MNWPCTLCGSRHWPDPESSCPLCNHPAGGAEGYSKARETAIMRFVKDGCREKSATEWWDLIDQQTDEELHPETMAERLAWLHDDACFQAWENMEPSPSSIAWADVCALAGFDLCKNYSR